MSTLQPELQSEAQQHDSAVSRKRIAFPRFIVLHTKYPVAKSVWRNTAGLLQRCEFAKGGSIHLAVSSSNPVLSTHCSIPSSLSAITIHTRARTRCAAGATPMVGFGLCYSLQAQPDDDGQAEAQQAAPRPIKSNRASFFSWSSSPESDLLFIYRRRREAQPLTEIQNSLAMSLPLVSSCASTTPAAAHEPVLDCALDDQPRWLSSMPLPLVLVCTTTILTSTPNHDAFSASSRLALPTTLTRKDDALPVWLIWIVCVQNQGSVHPLCPSLVATNDLSPTQCLTLGNSMKQARARACLLESQPQGSSSTDGGGDTTRHVFWWWWHHNWYGRLATSKINWTRKLVEIMVIGLAAAALVQVTILTRSELNLGHDNKWDAVGLPHHPVDVLQTLCGVELDLVSHLSTSSSKRYARHPSRPPLIYCSLYKRRLQAQKNANPSLAAPSNPKRRPKAKWSSTASVEAAH